MRGPRAHGDWTEILKELSWVPGSRLGCPLTSCYADDCTVRITYRFAVASVAAPALLSLSDLLIFNLPARVSSNGMARLLGRIPLPKTGLFE